MSTILAGIFKELAPLRLGKSDLIEFLLVSNTMQKKDSQVEG